jgi:hypothetical protein
VVFASETGLAMTISGAALPRLLLAPERGICGRDTDLQDTGHYSIQPFFSISVLVRRTKRQ